MIGLSLLYMVIIALTITLLFSYGFRVRGPWGSLWTFFLIIFLGVVAADLWLDPIGPYFMDVYWVPPIVVALFIALLLAASTPPTRPKNRTEQKIQEMAEEQANAVVLGSFFWLFIVFMLILVTVGLINNF